MNYAVGFDFFFFFSRGGLLMLTKMAQLKVSSFCFSEVLDYCCLGLNMGFLMFLNRWLLLLSETISLGFVLFNFGFFFNLLLGFIFG